MDLTLTPALLQGRINAIPSKSQAHRLLICAAFADKQTFLHCPDTNRDIEATAACLRALGAQVCRTAEGYRIDPLKKIPEKAELPCCESGSTLRFLLPVAGALGVDTTFLMEGRLPQRPISPLQEEMERMGCRITRPTANTIRCSGKLRCGDYAMRGDISSQFITGLLFAMALLPERSALKITGKLESAPYVAMTLQALQLFGADLSSLETAGNLQLHSPGEIRVEGDWSNAAFFLAAKALGNPVEVSGLSEDSLQGDRAAATLLDALREHCCIDATDIPDLVPILAVVAGANHGAVFTGIRRLRLKESDRVATVTAMLTALGGKAEAEENTLTVYGTGYTGGTVDAAGDHRIAMAAAIAATVAAGPVTIRGAQCTEKSYPGFWEEYQRLGGQL